MKMTHLLTILALLLFGACDRTLLPILPGGNGDFTTNDLRFSFSVLDTNNVQRSEFRIGEDVRLRYVVENISDGAPRFEIPHLGPIATVSVLKNSLVFGTSDDGMDYPAIVVVDTLAPGDSTALVFDWLTLQHHAPLPAGNYTASVTPHLNFDDTADPVGISLPFSVTCEPDSDCVAGVMITEQPPADIQLDPFNLNEARISGDTLTVSVSYSGGCATHDFALFMSPAAFLESNPVQADLYIRHDSHGDLCEAYITTEVSFEVSAIARLYREFYDSGNEVILNVHQYFDTAPEERIQVSYQFE